MPLCPDTTNQLQENAKAHVRAQKAVLQHLDERIDEMEAELKSTEPDSPRAKLLQEGINSLRLEVRGQKLNPDTGQYDQVKKPGIERIAVMEALYAERDPRRFTYKNADGEERKADIYGMPTIKEMKKAGFEEAAREMVVRSLSLMATGDASRNPYDYLGTEGLEVKVALDRIVEHHHIYNNTVVREDGRVHPMSVSIRPGKNGKPELKVIPAYHGYNYENPKENQMDAVQFICLMDAMHSGDDAVCHLHYFKFDGQEAQMLKAKAVEKAKEKAEEAKGKLPRLQSELKVLQARRFKPQEYEDKLKTKEAELSQKMAPYLKEDGKLKPLPKGSDEANNRDSIQSELKKVRGDLEKHNRAETLKRDLATQEKELKELRGQKGAIASKVSYAKKKLKEGKDLTDEQKELLKQYDELVTKVAAAVIGVDKLATSLDKEGTIDAKVESKKREILESVQLSRLTEAAAGKLFDESNGFFSFDKGAAEKQAHETFRPKMNEEITKFTAREALEYLKESGLSLEEFYRQEYQRNLTNRLAALAIKLPG